ncbi:hypothetical protein SRABI13_00467 [Erwinia aphidicola]|uniref:hypothetical protein n=1 Tax=Erwinia aphidicola TaxID=68334 RepID=UPI001DBA6871|nr:hypothetical protein [Erwinia aphidicola]CAH0148567.1 hypothetical protein SRABI13_00467 [Erwinia aphidicola]
MTPYTNVAEVIAALEAGTVTENSVMAYARNKNLTNERRSMFRVAVYEYRIEKLKKLIKEEGENIK